MRLSYQVIDSFARRPFEGNPAGVCVLDSWLPDATMQAIAKENRLSETAFCVRVAPEEYELRWFTPTTEVDLCGHATFGTAYVLFDGPEACAQSIRFHATMAGHELLCERDGDRIRMEFPRIVPAPHPHLACYDEAVGAVASEVLATERDVVLVFDDERVVNELAPDLSLVAALEYGCSVYATAPSEEYDYVARSFFPKLGIPEDPVCGSMQSALVPYWSERLGKRELVCRQTSERGGTVWCEDTGENVLISGYGARYLSGTIEVPE